MAYNVPIITLVQKRALHLCFTNTIFCSVGWFVGDGMKLLEIVFHQFECFWLEEAGKRKTQEKKVHYWLPNESYLTLSGWQSPAKAVKIEK